MSLICVLFPKIISSLKYYVVFLHLTIVKFKFFFQPA